MANPVITHAFRTPIGKFLGALSDLSAVELGTSCARELFRRSGLDPALVSDVVVGNARGAGLGPNPARQVAIGAGCPFEVPAFTVNQACASGLRAVALAADAVREGRSKVVLAGGMESMSNVPFLLPSFRKGYRIGSAEVVDGMYKDGFLCPMADMTMGETAEILAHELGIDRKEQDAYALESQRKCQAAWEEGRFAAEIVPIFVRDKKGMRQVETDEHPRKDLTAADLAKLPPVFRKDGTVHAGNSSGITDGAAMLLVMDENVARDHGYEVLARCGPYQVAGVDPRRMGIGPVPALRALFERTGRGVRDHDVFELNEAFAAQVLACLREIPIPLERLNPNGGAIALGHPIGSTGARIVVTLLHALRRTGGRRGIATLCVSGGMGMAMAFEA